MNKVLSGHLGEKKEELLVNNFKGSFNNYENFFDYYLDISREYGNEKARGLICNLIIKNKEKIFKKKFINEVDSEYGNEIFTKALSVFISNIDIGLYELINKEKINKEDFVSIVPAQDYGYIVKWNRKYRKLRKDSKTYLMLEKMMDKFASNHNKQMDELKRTYDKLDPHPFK